jgi:hypothetical protein
MPPMSSLPTLAARQEGTKFCKLKRLGPAKRAELAERAEHAATAWGQDTSEKPLGANLGC